MKNFLSGHRGIGALSIAAIAVIFLAVNIFASAAFRNARLDLTEGKLFTLSQGTINILASLDEPVTIKLYYSRSVATQIQQVHRTAERLQDLLAEFGKKAGGNLVFELVPVERYTASEDEAAAQGMTGAQGPGGELIYFGLVATNMVDGREAVPFVPLDRETYLEYDLISIIYRLNRTKLPVLGLISALPLEAGPAGLQGGLQAAMGGQALSQPYVIYDQLLGSFEVEHIDTQTAFIPNEVEVLLIAHPEPLSTPMLYAIDQFVMGGGRVLGLLDPYSEMSQTGQPPQMMGQDGQPSAINDSSAAALGPLLASWGVALDPGFLVADRELGFYVPQSEYPPLLLWPRLTEAQIDRDDIVSGELSLLQLASAGTLTALEEATTTFTPLITTSLDSALVDYKDAKFRKPFEEVLADFVPDEKTHVLAVRLQGKVTSAFPDGANNSEGDDGAGPHLKETDAANIILIADADFMDDRFWVSIQNFLGERLVQPTTDNGALVISAIENLMGSNDLISLRARTGSQRPFTLVEKIQRAAEEEYLPRQQELETKLEQIGARVDELRGAQSLSGSAQEAIIVTAEERGELQALLAEHEQTRKAQRTIKFNLGRDIERLGNRVRFINIAVMPLIVAAFAIGLAGLRARRRRRNANLST